MENPLNLKKPADYLRIGVTEEGKIISGECDWPGCGELFYHSFLDQHSDDDRAHAKAQLAEQHLEHMKQKHELKD